jgi:trans-aconitate methyltransferase
MTRLLEIGPGFRPQAHANWPEAEIYYLCSPNWKADYEAMPANLRRWYDKFEGRIFQGDAKNLVYAVDGEKFDIVFASHVLEHFPWFATEEVLKTWVNTLLPGGELHIVVPSLEWVADQVIMQEQPSKALLPHLFGGLIDEYDVHVTAFTMRYLRAKIEKVGLNCIKAITTNYPIVAGGEVLTSEQHYAVGKLPIEGD